LHPKPFRLRVTRIVRLLAACCSLACEACSTKPEASQKPTFPVKGQVLAEGRPASGVLVVFHLLDATGPQPLRAYARTDADGTFTLSTYQPHDGAPAGRYAVTVVSPDDNEGRHWLPPRYALPDTSGLRVEIKPGTNQLTPFRLRRN
jgi:hypothetical protein